ncbi:MAG: ThiF family adenylyltransferase [Sumerlaeia bacterium]
MGIEAPVNIDLDSERYALLRISGSARRELEKLVFSRHPEREWGTFFMFGFRRTPWGCALSYVSAAPPLPGDLDRNTHVVKIRSGYTFRAMGLLDTSPLGIGVVHSHPQGRGTIPSPLDDKMDRYFGTELFLGYGVGNERPYSSLILNRREDGTLEFSGRVRFDGRWIAVREFLIVGDALERISSHQNSGFFQRNEGLSESTTARLESLLGSTSRDRLQRAVVGIVGCSGTGSPAVEALARAGVGELVLVDPQRLSPSNLERVHGSTLADVSALEPPYKVACMARMIRAINPDCRVRSIVGNVLDDEVRDEFLRCDLILGCSDTHHARAALGDLCALYLVPSLDVGVQMDGRGGKVSSQTAEVLKLSPDLPCPFCHGRISPVALSQELMSEEERVQRQQAAQEAREQGGNPGVYWADEPQLHTVGYLTTVLGAMAAGYAIGWMTGSFGMPGDRFQFDLSKPSFAFALAPGSRKPDCTCGMLQGYSDQGRADFSISRPGHWSAPVIIEASH